MNNSETIEKMKKLKLFGMLTAYTSAIESGLFNKCDTDEIIAQMIDYEWEDRYNRKLARLLKNAGLRYQASVEQIDFNLKRNLKKNEILKLCDCLFIQQNKNIIITGPTGVGKSYIGCAIGHQACILSYKTKYFNYRKLFLQLKLSKADGTYLKFISKINTHELLIIDDFGLEKLDSNDRLSLLDILEERYGNKSTIIISQIPVSSWFDIIGDKTIADAICDRIIHSSLSLNLKGDSARKFYGKQLTK